MSLKARWHAWVNRPRCPYQPPAARENEQCIYREGHSGTCCTRTIYGEYRGWYGINFDHTTGKYQRHRSGTQ